MLTVFGSVLLNLITQAPRLALGPDTVLSGDFTLTPGGRGANQTLAAHCSGAKVRFAALAGRDAFGDLALATLRENNIDLAHVQRVPLSTGLCVTAHDGLGQCQTFLGLGANAHISIDDLPVDWLSSWTTLLLQGEMNTATLVQTVERIKAAEGKCILHLAPLAMLPEWALDAPDYLVLNENDAMELAARFAMRTDSPQAVAFDIASRRRGPVLIIGANHHLYIALDGQIEHVLAPDLPAVDPLGADDALVGVFAAAIAGGKSIADAAYEGVAAAALTASKPGLQTAFPDGETIKELVATWPQKTQERISLRKA